MTRSNSPTILLGTLAAFIAAAALPVTVVVTSTADVVTGCATSGTPAPGTTGCTLRDAITYSNSNPAPPPAQNLILFQVPGSGVQTITLSADLPDIATATVIDGYSQPGSSPNTLAIGSDTVLLIDIQSGPGLNHLLAISGGIGSLVRGLVISHQFFSIPDAVPVALTLDSCCNTITGNFIGVDPSGTSGGDGEGIVLVNSSFNQVGGPAPADRNVLVGGSIGVLVLEGDANSVEGNYIGTNAAGNAGLGGGTPGIFLSAAENVIRHNVISGNSYGVVVVGVGGGNSLSGNLIGTDAAAVAAIPNHLDGVHVADRSGNIIGSSGSSNPILGFLSEGNLIAFNGQNGITIAEDADADGILDSVSNSLLSNSIFGNGALGIDLTGLGFPPDGVTPNDPGDGDTGSNELQNYAVLTAASGLVQTDVTGTLASAPKTTYRIQFFSTPSCDPSGFGEGETLVDEVFVTTNGSGNAKVHDGIFPRVPTGQFLTSTATDPLGNTSEFSQCVLVTAVGPPPPPPLPSITRFLEEGPIRVKPGVPVEIPVGVGASVEARAAASGTVAVSDDSGIACQASLIRSGVGACALTFPSEGTYHVRAHYAGDGVFLGSDSHAIVVKVKESGGD